MDTHNTDGNFYEIPRKAKPKTTWLIWAKDIQEAIKEAKKLDKKEEAKIETQRNTKEYEQIKGKDNVKSPGHYVSDKGFEVFDVQEAYIHDLKGMAASYWCNVVKYILRFQIKNGVEDLKKAKYYLEKLIKEQENRKEI